MNSNNYESIFRIAVIGPESSGKSILCEQLANYYQTTWIPEFARAYLQNLNRPYDANDIVEIYKTQFNQEKSSLKSSNKFIFVDTEFIIGKVWQEHLYGKSDSYFDEMIATHPYNFYLLTYPDLPWEFDPLRENPGKGLYFYEWYKKILSENQLQFETVSGTGASRLQCAINILEKRY